MANELLNPPETETAATSGSSNGPEFTSPAGSANKSFPSETGHELDAFLGKAFEEKSAWSSLYESVHEVFFPVKLPPLELTSTPIPVVDPMATKWSPTSWAIASVVNLAILALLLFAFRHQINSVLPTKLQLNVLDAEIPAWKPTTKKAGNIGGGGGGGQHDLLPPSKGRLPKLDPKPMLAPQVATVVQPKLPVTPAIDVQKDIKLPDNPNLPNLGLTQSQSVVLSSGSGSNGIGTGKNGGVGGGNGNGLGPGQGGNVGGGLRRIGDGVTEPKAIFQPEAEFSDEARRAKYEGIVLISLIVDANGNPQNVRVARTLGMGLDEKALEAVRQYKFKPAVDKATGKPVPVPLSVEVKFRLY